MDRHKMARAVFFAFALLCLAQSGLCLTHDLSPETGDAGLSPAGQAVLGRVLSSFANGNQIEIKDLNVNTSAWLAYTARENTTGGFKETQLLAKRSYAKELAAAIASALKGGLIYSGDTTVLRPEGLNELFSHDSELDIEAEASLGEVPGLTAVVYQDFLTKASAVGVQLLEENFKKVKLDSVRAVAKVPVLGDFDIKLEHVHLEGISLDKARTGVSLGKDGEFELVIKDMDAIVDGHFQWRRTRFPFISGGCQAKVTAVNGEVNLKVTVVGDMDGRPKVTSMDAAHISFDSLSIVTSGAKLSWLYNAVAALAHTQIQDAITCAVGKQVSTTIPGKINVLLKGVPTLVNIKGLELNTSLARSPKVTPDRLIVWDWGRFQNPDHKLQACPFVRDVAISAKNSPILPGGSPYQIIADIDETIVNCLTWDMFKAGKLQALLQGDDLPEKALYTDSWRFVIPSVWLRCPGCPMAVNATVTSAPKTKILESQGIVSQGTAELSFFLAEETAGDGASWTHTEELSSSIDRRQLNTGSSETKPSLGEHLFTLSLQGELSVRNLTLDQDPSSNGWRLNLSMKVNQAALKVGVVESDVGSINEAALHFALTVASFLVEDKVNHGILADGFPLPDIPHVNVDRANVTVVDHALALGGDFSYAGS